ncbi:Ark- serine/threonine protein kinase [Blastocladiella emersonii ATCC 22665]|nr:Ark- serine/threonine protein kinase [Blastocladiella emersonii ATCC 22665]
MKLMPGATVQVGSHRALVDRFLAEGGLAHVYLARLEPTGEVVVLKSVTTNTSEGMRSMQNEVQYMRMFSGHKNIVRFIDAEFVNQNGQHTFILMEYCQGGHVVDLMNSRLHDRLKEREILKIFGDACEGVARLHYAKPPVIHRDIKVENLLVSNSDHFKLCDFGSATTQILPPRSATFTVSKIELDVIHEDVQKHTTLQYRAPELCDVYMGRGINEKVDVWALGVMLYKLCYYTTPFEKEGVNAIMNARYRIPAEPPFSGDLIATIRWCLLEDPARRPTIFQLVAEVSRLRGLPCPIDNIYADAPPIPAVAYMAQLTRPQPPPLLAAMQQAQAQGTFPPPQPQMMSPYGGAATVPGMAGGIPPRPGMPPPLQQPQPLPAPMRRGRVPVPQSNPSMSMDYPTPMMQPPPPANQQQQHPHSSLQQQSVFQPFDLTASPMPVDHMHPPLPQQQQQQASPQPAMHPPPMQAPGMSQYGTPRFDDMAAANSPVQLAPPSHQQQQQHAHQQIQNSPPSPLPSGSGRTPMYPPPPPANGGGDPAQYGYLSLRPDGTLPQPMSSSSGGGPPPQSLASAIHGSPPLMLSPQQHQQMQLQLQMQQVQMQSPQPQQQQQQYPPPPSMPGIDPMAPGNAPYGQQQQSQPPHVQHYKVSTAGMLSSSGSLSGSFTRITPAGSGGQSLTGGSEYGSGGGAPYPPMPPASAPNTGNASGGGGYPNTLPPGYGGGNTGAALANRPKAASVSGLIGRNVYPYAGAGSSAPGSGAGTPNAALAPPPPPSAMSSSAGHRRTPSAGSNAMGPMPGSGMSAPPPMPPPPPAGSMPQSLGASAGSLPPPRLPPMQGMGAGLMMNGNGNGVGSNSGGTPPPPPPSGNGASLSSSSNGGSSGSSGVVKRHRKDQRLQWMDRYFSCPEYKRKYLVRLVTETWRCSLEQQAPMAWWLDRVGRIMAANGVLASLRALLLVHHVLQHSAPSMVADLAARRGVVDHLCNQWRSAYDVRERFTQLYARVLAQILLFHTHVAAAGIALDGNFHLVHADALSTDVRIDLAQRTRELILGLEPYFIFLFENGPDLQACGLPELHYAILAVLEAAYALYTLHMYLLSQVRAAAPQNMQVVVLVNELQNTSTYLGHLSTATSRSVMPALLDRDRYRVPIHRPSTETAARWTQPASLMPKVVRRLQRRGINTAALGPEITQQGALTRRPEYGSVYDAATREFDDSSDSE